ncbi:MAG TPA: outer membrane lipid asymmetry maintenance protein MlaD [Sphingomonas sp.]|nr:outer membrane lipid asymmetry maintenance protein MlaD [Sphingomonas sp.]
MRSVLKEHGAEALIGLLVVILAIWFVIFAWHRTGGGSRADAIHVMALFPNATGVNVGTDVRVAGLKIGQVSAQRLDPKTYEAEVTLALNPNVKLPADSAAAITSEGILGGSYIAMIPGGDSTPLKNGDTIVDTQGSVDLMGMIGQFVNHSGGGAGGSGGSGTTGSPGSASPPTP